MSRGLDLGFVLIWVEDVESTVRFYQALGLRHRFTVDTVYGPFAEFGTPAGGAGEDAGSVRLCIADVKEARARHGEDLDPEFGTASFELIFVHDDVNAVWKAAMEAGATPVREPAPQPCWETLVAWFRDPNGMLVSVQERIEPRELARRLVAVAGEEAVEAIMTSARGN
jgi:catechol 2,3-dioxygenase-like lactoylglutathione lyase family enzyme